MTRPKYISAFVFIMLTAFVSLAQEQPVDSLIRVESPFESINEQEFPGAILYLRNAGKQVFVQHRGIEMYCDKAVFYKESNFIKAIGNVRMNQGDTITMSSKYAEYNGGNQLAFASGNVNMRSPESTLQTDTLWFNRKRQQAYYRSGGTVRDTASTLKSRVGTYFMKDKKYQFLDKVVVTNPEYVINSNHLNFYSDSGYVYMYGPSTITGKTSKVYCERGFYDTRADEGYFVKNSSIDYNDRNVKGDSLYFNRGRDFASGVNNIKITDTINNSIIKGDYAEVFRSKDSVFITKRAVAISLQGQDSVYIHADTLMITGKEDDRLVRGFYDVRLFKSDLSGRSDSIVSRQTTGLTKMITNPVLWSGKSQITGDSIFIQSNVETEKLDSLRVFYNAFIADQDTAGGFNQIKGKELTGLFKDNELSIVNIDKNVEHLIYLRNDIQELIGIDKRTSGRMVLELENQEVIVNTYYNEAKGTTFPPEELPVNARTLRGLNWREEERPYSYSDLFKGQPVPKQIKIQGLPLPKVEEDFFTEDDLENLNENSELKKEDLENREKDKIENIEGTGDN
ncbi:OstA-like protein [Nonlabens sp. Hel1_33_55]|uniref:OstA-like protein n=1 Tax=Nonlabens sp. Hel1_33_55 TaxID=1336802 RepID=UPI000875EC86|nr:OstA-like protein [Nonlabens sp. Hel1_33_55]SCX94943.1 OstA-like protein [Nonlabens sp. Hel1_33_55]